VPAGGVEGGGVIENGLRSGAGGADVTLGGVAAGVLGEDSPVVGEAPPDGVGTLAAGHGVSSSFFGGSHMVGPSWMIGRAARCLVLLNFGKVRSGLELSEVLTKTTQGSDAVPGKS
jgi:hypothetical protein